jgi:HK97 family phage major capsid protein/HK97 family phage prohead protease
MASVRSAVQRAYSVLEIKSVDAEQRIITGLATTPTPDRTGDVVIPEGATFSLPIPLLWQHDSRQPIGEVYGARVTAKGIEIEARLAKIEEPGPLKDRIDMAWQSIKAKLVRGLSIGFRSIVEAFDKETYGFIFQEWEWLELSAVTIPANADASIQTIKSCDLGVAASGTSSKTAHSPGVSGKSRVVSMRTSTDMKKSFADQIAGFEATRAAKAAKMDEILTKSADAGTTLDAAQKEEHDTLDAEIVEIDEHLTRLRAAQKREAAAAVEVKGDKPANGVLQVREGGRIIMADRKLDKGIAFAQYALCMAASRGIPGEAMRLAKEHYANTPGVLALVEKTAVAGGSTSGSHYLDDMVPYNVMNDFIEYLRPGSIIGKFGGPNPGGGANYPSLNRVGFNERVSGMSTGSTAGWKGEGLPALPSAAVTFNTSLTWNCMSALAVLTKEAIRFSNPSAEARVRDDLARAVNQKLDNDFIDPAKAAIGTTSPASITDSIVATTPSGTAATNVRHDIAALFALYAVALLDPSDVVLIMSGSIAAQLAMMTNTLGQRDFPEVTFNGGMIAGRPVIVSELLTGLGSPSTQMIVAVKASEIYLADDGVVTVEASDQASIEMVDTSSQSGISGTGASLVSLWQSGLVGLMANREITWKRRRTTAVQYLSPCAYVVPTS